jgi:hypothetical protein
MRISGAILDQNDGIDAFIDHVFASQFLADLGLQRGESKDLMRVVTDYEIDRSVAKIAYPVKENDAIHELRFYRNSKGS